MKKLLSFLGTVSLIIPPVTSLVGCSYSFLGPDLASLPSYDWKQEEPYFSAYQPTSISNSVINSGQLRVDNSERYLNYRNFNTGYKNPKGIYKQAVTGAPLNAAYLPNGNYRKDFGERDRNLLFSQINSILDWNPAVDQDLKYNQSDQKLLKTKKVAGKWVTKQDPTVKTMNMGLAVRSTSGESTVVGTNRLFNYNFNNWQYVNTFTAWAGAADEGIIVPPPADAVNAAHINGTKMYGNIYLDGYNGLTRSMLTDFLAKDSNGNYLIVDVLIAMAKYLGFDGWFWNYEPNGGAPDGFIMDISGATGIINQFMNKVKSSSDPAIKNLQIISYRNYGNLKYLDNGQVYDVLADQLAKATDGHFQQDFYVYPNETIKWSSHNPNYNPLDLYNMYNLGGWINNEIFYNEKRIGTRDIRDLTQLHLDPATNQPYTDVIKENDDLRKNKWAFSGKNVNSLSIFASSTATDLARSYLDKQPKISLKNDLYAVMLQNEYDDMIYTGRNRFLSNDDHGSISLDSNFDVSHMSYGVGNVVLENTVLFDNDPDALAEFKTNFSTGQGQLFVNDDGTVIKNYPWNNRRLTDTQPTYKWDIHKTINNNNNEQVKTVKGYYDYYDAYQKGNSLALGSGFDENGKVIPGIIDQPIVWNIMGTNYQSSAKELNFKIKLNNWNRTELKKYFNIVPVVTLNDGSTVNINDVKLKDLANNWIDLTANISQNIVLKSDQKIAKLGLAISPTTNGAKTPVKMNVGEFKVHNLNLPAPTTVNTINGNYITNLNNEYSIYRDDKYNIRLNWTINENLRDEISYYQIYLENGNGAYYYLGQTTNRNYYLHSLDLQANSKIIIKTVNRDNPNKSTYQSWTIN
ncbi:hypothetical protein SSYRP_v1c06900 [Spiroplasma syrphidicola EA-1]|uniref:Cytosolic endo-beta-N-acetylglucosaminidase TIM barrel domain-containing protein n=1 Tax=Spiroplasma syrphidicola EA-1 TaxID=1276229 RepID=R4UJH0_9MOLU|nr:lipoprotein [Spiroplasma syrphidicola]AGM26280.1 hypothetical protein SSYRP_v1c06900 [Spiroplasma syrphidicola EA-1]